jgi:hypothetical protein
MHLPSILKHNACFANASQAMENSNLPLISASTLDNVRQPFQLLLPPSKVQIAWRQI